MKNYVIVILLLLVLAAGALFLLWRPDTKPQKATQHAVPTWIEMPQDTNDFPDPPPGSVVFDLKYRGLGGEKDELRYNSFWGFGQSGGNDADFITEVKKKAANVEMVYNRYFSGAEWAAVETIEDEPVAFYFDLNADGKVSENERMLPASSEKSGTTRRWVFVTPDFLLTTDHGLRVPFRTLLQVSFYGDSSHPNCMWRPSCVLEGASHLDGKQMKLILYASGFSGSFTEFGRCSYSLLAADAGFRGENQMLNRELIL